MEVKDWLPLAVSVGMFLIAWLTLRRNTTADTTETATARATLSADVRYIRSSVDEIKVENRLIRKDVDELKTKIVEIEASANNAHKRIDDLKER